MRRYPSLCRFLAATCRTVLFDTVCGGESLTLLRHLAWVAVADAQLRSSLPLLQHRRES